MKKIVKLYLLLGLVLTAINDAKSQNVVYIPGTIITVSDSVTYTCNVVAEHTTLPML